MCRHTFSPYPYAYMLSFTFSLCAHAYMVAQKSTCLALHDAARTPDKLHEHMHTYMIYACACAKGTSCTACRRWRRSALSSWQICNSLDMASFSLRLFAKISWYARCQAGVDLRHHQCLRLQCSSHHGKRMCTSGKTHVMRACLIKCVNASWDRSVTTTS
jgi:hypothetical protein